MPIMSTEEWIQLHLSRAPVLDERTRASILQPLTTTAKRAQESATNADAA